MERTEGDERGEGRGVVCGVWEGQSPTLAFPAKISLD